MMKKLLSLTLAVVLVLSVASVAVFAAQEDIYKGDGEQVKGGTPPVPMTADLTGTSGYGSLTNADIQPAAERYISFGEATDTLDLLLKDGSAASGHKAEAKYLLDSDYFTMKVKKETNGSYVKSWTTDTEKKLDGQNRASYLVFKLAEYTGTDEIKTSGTITFTAKKDPADYKVKPTAGLNDWTEGEKYVFTYAIWISNEKVKGTDGDADAGDRVYFDPAKNDENAFIWGDDIAALEFTSDDGASKFYCRLSTKSDSAMYREYGDPIGADLWFYDFVTNPTIPSTSRGVLTLGIPWDEDDDYVPDPSDCFIYQVVDGELVDVTKQFSYGTDDYEIEGWSIKTRVLGTYVVSDMELNIAPEVEADPVETAPVEDGKVIPNTGC